MGVTRSETIEYIYSLKRIFVENQLTELMKAVNSDVQDLKYEYQTDGNVVYDEIVIIHFRSGGTHKVNVSGDSYKAITADVLKKI